VNTKAGMKTLSVNGIAVGEVSMTGDVHKDVEIARAFLKARNLLPAVSPARATLGQALAFATTAHAVHDTFLKTSPARNGMVSPPFVVNSAFSIELYLKALHLLQGAPSPWGHRLLDLFDTLHPDMRQKIQDGAREFGPDYLPREFAGIDIRTFIGDLDNAFVEWRYAHEGGITGVVHVYPTIFVMKVLHEVSQRIDLSQTPATPPPPPVGAI
jgi:hypothetical protein